MRFTDIAGLVRGASQGQGLGNQFLAHIRETDAICQVVRVFADPDVTHVDGDVSPERDIETVVTELILADLQTLEKALPRLAKETKFAKDPERARVAAAAAGGRAAPGLGDHRCRPARPPRASTSGALRELQLLTAKPFLYVFNMDVGELADDGPAQAPVRAGGSRRGDLPRRQDRSRPGRAARGRGRRTARRGRAGRARPGPAGPGRVPRAGAADLPDRGPEGDPGLEIKAGATAPEAAGVIHTDFQRGFIKAEVVSYDDLIAAGSLAAARAAGKARIEGKDYVMRDGDVVEFRFQTTSGGKAAH